MKPRNMIISLLAVVLVGIIVLSSATTVVQAIVPGQPPRGRPIPPSNDPNNDPQNVKYVTLPRVINDTYMVNGEGGTLVITGSTTVNFTAFHYYGIVIYNATKVVFNNVRVNVAKYIYSLRLIYIYNYGLKSRERITVTGNSLIINVNGDIESYWTANFIGLWATWLKSFSISKVYINYSPRIYSDRRWWRDSQYNISDIYIGGMYLRFYGTKSNKAQYYIDTLYIKAEPRPGNEQVVFDWIGIRGLMIRSYPLYYERGSKYDEIMTYSKGVIRNLYIMDSRIKAYSVCWMDSIDTYQTSLTVYYLTIENIAIARQEIHTNAEGRWSSSSIIYGISSYRSKIYLDKFLGSNVVQNMDYNEAYLFWFPRYTAITYRYIVTRNFGVGENNNTGGIFPIWYGFEGIGMAAGKAVSYKVDNNRVYKEFSLNHVFLRDTPAAIGSSGLKSISGYLSINTRNSGAIMLADIDDRMRTIYRDSVKYSRISISLRQSYDEPVYGITILYTQNMVSLLIFGKDIKVTINGKTYTVDMVVLSSSDAYIKGRIFMTRGDGSSARIFQRYGTITGIYSDYGTRGGWD
ncbi:MAG: hypothetical protein GXO43_00490 [Crenarchaeota archaeon]|nr:hypothetical protein [Thermoproteota archaeon]